MGCTQARPTNKRACGRESHLASDCSGRPSPEYSTRNRRFSADQLPGSPSQVCLFRFVQTDGLSFRLALISLSRIRPFSSHGAHYHGSHDVFFPIPGMTVAQAASSTAACVVAAPPSLEEVSLSCHLYYQHHSFLQPRQREQGRAELGAQRQHPCTLSTYFSVPAIRQ